MKALKEALSKSTVTKVCRMYPRPFDRKSFKEAFLSHADQYVKDDFRTPRTSYDIADPEQLDLILDDFNVASYTKYIVLAGTLGCGKTAILEILSKMLMHTHLYFPVMNDDRIHEMVGEYGYQALRTFSKKNLAINDFGVSTGKVNHFGNYIDPINQIIYSRYERGLVTIISTNLTKDAFLKRLDQRTIDRVESTMSWHGISHGINYRKS